MEGGGLMDSGRGLINLACIPGQLFPPTAAPCLGDQEPAGGLALAGGREEGDGAVHCRIISTSFLLPDNPDTNLSSSFVAKVCGSSGPPLVSGFQSANEPVEPLMKLIL